MSVWPESSRRDRSNFVQGEVPIGAQPPGEVVVAVEEHPRGMDLPRPLGDRRESARFTRVLLALGRRAMADKARTARHPPIQPARRTRRIMTPLVFMAAPDVVEISFPGGPDSGAERPTPQWRGVDDSVVDRSAGGCTLDSSSIDREPPTGGFRLAHAM